MTATLSCDETEAPVAPISIVPASTGPVPINSPATGSSR